MGSQNSKPTARASPAEDDPIALKQGEVVQSNAQDSTTTGSDNNSSSSSSGSGGGCPMKLSDGSYSYNWRKIFKLTSSKDGPSFPHGPKGSIQVPDKPPSSPQNDEVVGGGGGCPVRGGSMPPPTESQNDVGAGGGGGCPVREYNVYSQPLDPKNQMPKVANQLPAASQSKSLSTERVKSNIPKGGATEGTTWTYPSPQMFYNALVRKNKLDDTTEEDIDIVVALHNNMNEKTWTDVCKWEAILTGDEEAPKLLKFMGRPKDLSPKAMFKHYVLGHPLPFDRHDWTILRTDNTTVRYVIDYYHDESKESNNDDEDSMPHHEDYHGTPSLLIDVRPALDYPSNVVDRVFRMPYAVHVSKADSVSNLYMPLFPTTQMKQQTKESVQVFQNIINAANNNKQQQQGNEVQQEISEADAIAISKSFAQMLQECSRVQQKMKQCDSEEECTKASMDLTLCMAKILCPIQHQSLTKVLNSDHVDDADVIEKAYENVSNCVVLQTNQHQTAKQQHPKHFQ